MWKSRGCVVVVVLVGQAVEILMSLVVVVLVELFGVVLLGLIVHSGLVGLAVVVLVGLIVVVFVGAGCSDVGDADCSGCIGVVVVVLVGPVVVVLAVLVMVGGLLRFCWVWLLWFSWAGCSSVVEPGCGGDDGPDVTVIVGLIAVLW
jgi:hypothetical protein